MSALADRVSRRAEAAGVGVSAALLARLVAYYELLDHWNDTINLTSLTDPDGAIDRLLLEPLVAAAHVPRRARLIDLGSGGGSPAVPLALASDAQTLVMVESRARKSAFLREAIRQLDLAAQASVEVARFEELSRQRGFAGAFDVVSIRAVRVDGPTLSTASDFLATDGLVVLFRSISGPDPVQFLPARLAFVGTRPLLKHSTAVLTLFRRV